MRRIISSIDIGNNYIKLIVCEFIGSRMHILSANKVKTKGLEKDKVVNSDLLVSAITKATTEASDTIGIQIKKVVLGLNSNSINLLKSTSSIKIKNENGNVTGNDISKVIQNAAKGKIDEESVLAGVIPIEFILDKEKSVENPLGLSCKELELKAIIATCSKSYVGDIINALTLANIRVVDVVLNAIGDYTLFQTKTTKKQVGAVVNFGYDNTTVSIFNHGILTNTQKYSMGTKNIINDICFVNKLDFSNGEAIYNDFALSETRLANPKEYRLLTNKNGEEVKINQYDISELTASRLEEIMSLIKKEINLLTKREISYIIVTGGLTEMKDFRLALENMFGKNVYLGKVDLLGARDNAFSSSIGIIKYFDKKLKLKDKEFSIFDDNALKEMNSGGTRSNSTNGSLLSKVFGYFFDS